MSSKKKMSAVAAEKIVTEIIAKENWPFWIYPGERRPVIVQAKNERHAKHKVMESPEYDGFPVYIYSIDKFAGRCVPQNGGTNPPDMANEEAVEIPAQKRHELFVMVKVVGGLTERVEAFTSKGEAYVEADKIGQHLDKETDDLRVFHLPTHIVGTPDGREVAKEIYSADIQ